MNNDNTLCSNGKTVDYGILFLEMYDLLKHIDYLSQLHGTDQQKFYIDTLLTIGKRYRYEGEYELLKNNMGVI